MADLESQYRQAWDDFVAARVKLLVATDLEQRSWQKLQRIALQRMAEAPEAGKPRLAPCTCGCTEGRA